MKTKRLLSFLLLGALASGCSPQKPAAETPSELPGGKIVIRGSNTVGEELAPALIAEFKKDNASLAFDLETKGTSYGFGALMGGYCDVAGASRLPNKDELEVAEYHNVELNDVVIGSYAVAVVVNGKNTVADLTPAQVRDVFTGVIRNWKDVGGPDAPIHLYIRDPISGTYLGFKELAMENKPYAADPKLFTTFTNYAGILKAVAADPNGIGYSGIDATPSPDVKRVPIGGVEPNAASVNANKYPYARTLHLYTNKGKERPEALQFIQFVLSPKGQEVLKRLGDVPKS